MIPLLAAIRLELLRRNTALVFPLRLTAGDYSQLIPALAEELRKRLSDQEMMKLYLDMELPLAAVLADMEKEGVRVEGDRLA